MLNFYQDKDKSIQKLIEFKPNNSILIANNKIKVYGKFTDTSSLLGEYRDIITQENYLALSNSEKTKNNQTYYIIDGNAQIGIEYNYPIHLGIQDESLVVVTNEMI